MFRTPVLENNNRISGYIYGECIQDGLTESSLRHAMTVFHTSRSGSDRGTNAQDQIHIIMISSVRTEFLPTPGVVIPLLPILPDQKRVKLSTDDL